MEEKLGKTRRKCGQRPERDEVASESRDSETTRNVAGCQVATRAALETPVGLLCSDP